MGLKNLRGSLKGSLSGSVRGWFMGNGTLRVPLRFYKEVCGLLKVPKDHGTW